MEEHTVITESHNQPTIQNTADEGYNRTALKCDCVYIILLLLGKKKHYTISVMSDIHCLSKRFQKF